MMMMQVRQISEIIVGQDSGWATQTRKHSRTPWAALFRRHWLQTVAGIAVSAVLVYVSPALFLWMVPALAGLVCALPLSAASGSVVLAKVTRALGLLTVPEELALPRVVALRDETEVRLEELLSDVTIDRLLGDELARQRHFAAVQPRPAPTRGHPDVMYITARAKLADAQTAAEALSWLTPPERLAVLGDRDLFQALLRLVNPDVSDQQALRSA
jgi:membrane glycosyltransferase